MPALSRPRRWCGSPGRWGRRPGDTRSRPAMRGGPTTASERVETCSWRRGGGPLANPSAHPRARLTVVERIAHDLQHIMPAVGFVTDAWSHGMRPEHPPILERDRIERRDAGGSPRHPHHAIIPVAEAIRGRRVPPAAVIFEAGVADRAAELKLDQPVADAKETLGPRRPKDLGAGLVRDQPPGAFDRLFRRNDDALGCGRLSRKVAVRAGTGDRHFRRYGAARPLLRAPPQPEARAYDRRAGGRDHGNQGAHPSSVDRQLLESSDELRDRLETIGGRGSESLCQERTCPLGNRLP